MECGGWERAEGERGEDSSCPDGPAATKATLTAMLVNSDVGNMFCCDAELAQNTLMAHTQHTYFLELG